MRRSVLKNAQKVFATCNIKIQGKYFVKQFLTPKKKNECYYFEVFGNSDNARFMMNFQPKQISTIVQVILENGFTWTNSITYTTLFISHAVHAFAYRIYHIKSKGCYFIALTAVLVGKHSFCFLSERVKP